MGPIWSLVMKVKKNSVAFFISNLVENFIETWKTFYFRIIQALFI
jgi:hypothetical protein